MWVHSTFYGVLVSTILHWASLCGLPDIEPMIYVKGKEPLVYKRNSSPSQSEGSHPATFSQTEKHSQTLSFSRGLPLTLVIHTYSYREIQSTSVWT